MNVDERSPRIAAADAAESGGLSAFHPTTAQQP